MLAELPDAEVDNLCSILHKEWPQSIQAVNFLRTCCEWKKKKPSLDMQILYNEKNIKSGLFMLIYKSGCVMPNVTMYALDSYENELEGMFSDFLDKCDGRVIMSVISKKHIPIMKKLTLAKAFKTFSPENLVIFSMNLDKAKNLEISYPFEVEVKPLRKEHLIDIYEVWILKPILNLEDLENCFELNNESAWGVFCKKTGRLLSRCLRLHNGSIGALQTIEEARGRGYATLLLKHASKKLAEQSIVPYTYTADYNKPALQAMFGAGFEVVNHATDTIIEKVSNT